MHGHSEKSPTLSRSSLGAGKGRTLCCKAAPVFRVRLGIRMTRCGHPRDHHRGCREPGNGSQQTCTSPLPTPVGQKIMRPLPLCAPGRELQVGFEILSIGAKLRELRPFYCFGDFPSPSASRSQLGPPLGQLRESTESSLGSRHLSKDLVTNLTQVHFASEGTQAPVRVCQRFPNGLRDAFPRF